VPGCSTESTYPSREQVLARTTQFVLDVLPETDFLVGDAELLVSGVDTLGAPLECLRYSSPARPPWELTPVPPELPVVRGPDDLRGKVRITTPESALRYCRLFSSPAILSCLPEPWDVEVLSSKDLDLRLMFGRSDSLRRVRMYLEVGDPYRPWAILRPAEWRSLGLTRPVVERTPTGFAVTRWMCLGIPSVLEGGARRLSLVRMSIGEDGAVAREVLEERDIPTGLELGTPVEL
jgi:hypothetical protein